MENIIFISAQPDEFYFLWQLELLIRNLSELGIKQQHIHILIGVKNKNRVSKECKSVCKAYSTMACFYIYEDKRQNPIYISSIRPHLIQQHYKKNKYLENETIFYHDSDILFSRIPKITLSKSIYVSDTRSYITTKYLIKAGSEELLEQMSKVVGIPKEMLIKNDNNAGGAQYILQNLNSKFWGKVERDSEKLFNLMESFNNSAWELHYAVNGGFRTKFSGVQSWCADMWSLLWNLWLFGHRVEIHNELDFSWPDSPIQDWKKKAILHYAGRADDKKGYFRKSTYLNYAPWYDDRLKEILSINQESCSKIIFDKISLVKNEFDNKRITLKDSCIVLYTTNSINTQIERLFNIVSDFISKYIDVKIYLLINSTKNKSVDNENEPKSNEYFNKFLFIPLGIVLAIKDIEHMFANTVQEKKVFYLAKKQYEVNHLFQITFGKILDIKFLTDNKGKFSEYERNSTTPIILYKLNTPITFSKIIDLDLRDSENSSNYKNTIPCLFNFSK